MGLNLDAIKAKLNQLNKTDDRRNNLWKPEAGPKTRVRIVIVIIDTQFDLYKYIELIIKCTI